MPINNGWYLVSSHGSILFFVAASPDCTIDEMADAMSLTRRTVWGLIGDLRRAGMVNVRRNGRRHHYTVNPEAPFLHPTIENAKLSDVLGAFLGSGTSAAGATHDAGDRRYVR